MNPVRVAVRRVGYKVGHVLLRNFSVGQARTPASIGTFENSILRTGAQGSAAPLPQTASGKRCSRYAAAVRRGRRAARSGDRMSVNEPTRDRLSIDHVAAIDDRSLMPQCEQAESTRWVAQGAAATADGSCHPVRAWHRRSVVDEGVVAQLPSRRIRRCRSGRGRTQLVRKTAPSPPPR